MGAQVAQTCVQVVRLLGVVNGANVQVHKPTYDEGVVLYITWQCSRNLTALDNILQYKNPHIYIVSCKRQSQEEHNDASFSFIVRTFPQRSKITTQARLYNYSHCFNLSKTLHTHTVLCKSTYDVKCYPERTM